MNAEKGRLISSLKSQPISVGILASNWLKFSNTLEILEKHQINLLHFDIADGRFSPLFTAGSIAVQQFPSTFIKDVHLMVNDQLNVAKKCVAAGANIITLQVENKENLEETLQWLQTQDTVLIGLTICPNTPLKLLEPYLAKIDLIQILTLDPRTGKKASLNEITERLSQLHKRLNDLLCEKLISVDGSMTFELASSIKKCGIDWVVSGSTLFSSLDLHKTLVRWKTLQL